MQRENTLLTASMISRRERKFSCSRILRGPSGPASPCRGQSRYFCVKMPGSARRKR